MDLTVTGGPTKVEHELDAVRIKASVHQGCNQWGERWPSRIRGNTCKLHIPEGSYLEPAKRLANGPPTTTKRNLI